MPTIAVLWLLIGVLSICVILLCFYVVRNKKKIEELQEQSDKKGKKIAHLSDRLTKVEDWTLKNQRLRLERIRDWVGRVQLGSSDISVKKRILPALKEVCEECDTGYWQDRAGTELKSIRGYVKARMNGGQRKDILDEIDTIADEFDIDLNTV